MWLTPNQPLWVSLAVCAVTGVATREDLRSRRIPNVVTGPALLLGIAAHWVFGGNRAAVLALGAAIVAGGILVPGWLMRFMGAGDVKLMAAIGAWLGTPRSGLYAVLFSLVAGGIISVVVAARRGILMRTVRDAALLLPKTAAGAMGTGLPPATSGVYVPKALAFLAGSLFALWGPI